MGDGDNNYGYQNYATGWLGAGNNTYTNGATIGPNPQQYAAPTGRHTDGSNFLLADGHVKWLRGQNVSPGLSTLRSANPSTAPANAAGGQFGQPTAEGTGGSVYVATFSVL